jgi:hypothetical protein
MSLLAVAAPPPVAAAGAVCALAVVAFRRLRAARHARGGPTKAAMDEVSAPQQHLGAGPPPLVRVLLAPARCNRVKVQFKVRLLTIARPRGD